MRPMSDSTSPRAPDLQPAALNTHTRYEPHPDSAEAVRTERQRCAKELEPMCRERVSATPSRVARDSSSLGTLPSDHVSNRESRDVPSRHGSIAGSRASTQADDVGTCAEEEEENKGKRQWYDGIVNFWTTQISLTIDEGAHRDHLGMSCLLACPCPPFRGPCHGTACCCMLTTRFSPFPSALERTFLGYLRTSLLLVMTGVTIAQLFHLQHTPTPNARFGFHKVGKPLAATFICMAIVVVFIGAARFWRLQSKLTQGKALAGGAEVFLVMGMVATMLVGTFGLVLAIDIEKTHNGR